AAGAERRAALGQAALGVFHALPLFADQRLGRDARILEHYLRNLRAAVPGGIEHLADLDAGRIGVDDERRDAGSGAREGDEVMRLGRVGDEDLAAVEDITIAPPFAPRLQRPAVRAQLRLR